MTLLLAAAHLKPIHEAAPKFLDFAFIMVLIGTLALAFLLPVVPPLVERRLTLLATVAAVAFVPAILWEKPDDDFATARLILAIGAATVLLPQRGGRKVMFLALLAAAAELTLRVIPTESPTARDVFTDALDLGHLAGASVWVGGLTALATLAATTRAKTPPGFWTATFKRFSLVATVCVGVMVLTGLWTYWLHVGAPRLLVHTLYGETLLVKLVLVGALLGLGAVNQLILIPRARTAHLRRVVALEAVLGLLVLLVVPFLSGSARNQDFQAHGGGPAKAPPPPITTSTWIWGAGWVVVVLATLIGAGLVARRLERRHADRVLVPA